jgi:hypothetical protein
MKKTSLLLEIAIFALLFVSSCSEEIVTSSPVYVNKLPQATISGYVNAEMNLQTSGLEFVPNGTQLFIEVNYSDLNSMATGKWKDTVSVTNGKYQVGVPANGSGVTVTLTPLTFESTQVQAYGSFFNQINKIYTAAPVAMTVRAGQTLSQNILFTNLDLPNFTDKVSITGKAQANLDASIVGLENLPNGTIINFFNGAWKDSCAVQNGVYNIVVPKSTTINWKSKFRYAKNVWNSNTMTYDNSHTYEFTIIGSAAFVSNTTGYDFSAGEGTDTYIDPLANVVQITGNAQADLDLTISGFENIPDGTKVTFYASDNSWGGTATITGGRYNINIPRNKFVSYTGTFNYLKRTSTTTTVLTTYVISGSIPATSTSTLVANLTAY